MSRLEMVTSVADMDGGAHVDPTFDAKYAAFRSGELLANQFTFQNGSGILRSGAAEPNPVRPLDEGARFVGDPQYACIRTIAHEFLLTMERSAAWAFEQGPYRWSPSLGEGPTVVCDGNGIFQQLRGVESRLIPAGTPLSETEAAFNRSSLRPKWK